jgi:antirestriction protein ArdC
MTAESREDIYTRVTNHILKAMEEGPGKFKPPWHGAGSSTIPVNAATNSPYRGANVLTLWVTAHERGYQSERWATYKQWAELGAHVRHGEKAAPVVFWKVTEAKRREQGREEGEEATEKLIIARGYSVFNAAQVEGYKAPAVSLLAESERIRAAEEFFRTLGPAVQHRGGQAFYQPSTDTIVLPPFSAFHSALDFYSALAHEATHWSGAPGRLNRDLSGRFGSQAYAAEELVAELGAAFTLARLNLSAEPRPDHAAYIAAWHKLLKEDKRAIFVAAGKAQEGVDWMLREHDRRAGVEAQASQDRSAAAPRGAEAAASAFMALPRDAAEEREGARAAKLPQSPPRMPVQSPPPATEADIVRQDRRNFANLMRLLGKEFQRRLEVPGYQPLVVERLDGPPLISMTQYGTLNGYPVRDPKVVFLVQNGNQARPVYFRNDYLGIEHATVPHNFGDVSVMPDLQRDLDSFVSGWWPNIKSLGFFDKADALNKEQAAQARPAGKGRNEVAPGSATKESARVEHRVSDPEAVPSPEAVRRVEQALAAGRRPPEEEQGEGRGPGREADREMSPQAWTRADAEQLIAERVEEANRALSRYEDPEKDIKVASLLADLMHWSRRQGLDFEHCVEEARALCEEEVVDVTEEHEKKEPAVAVREEQPEHERGR